MTDLRENLGWIVVSITAGASAILGWIFSLELLTIFIGLFTTLIGVLIGASITYFSQKKTQERAWQREYSIKIVEEVYGDLFKDIKNVIRYLEEKLTIHLTFLEWGQIQESHRYFMVDEKFRKKLDQFSLRISTYNDAVNRLENKILPRQVNKIAKKIFGVEPNTIPNLNVDVKYREDSRDFSVGLNTVRCLKDNDDPIEYASRHEDGSEISDVRLSIHIQLRDGSAFRSDKNQELDKFWQLCLKRRNEDKTYQFIIEEKPKLLVEATKMMKELVKRIEEPWKI